MGPRMPRARSAWRWAFVMNAGGNGGQAVAERVVSEAHATGVEPCADGAGTGDQRRDEAREQDHRSGKQYAKADGGRRAHVDFVGVEREDEFALAIGDPGDCARDRTGDEG